MRVLNEYDQKVTPPGSSSEHSRNQCDEPAREQRINSDDVQTAQPGSQHADGSKEPCTGSAKQDFATSQHESASVGANKCFGPSTVEVCLLNTGYVLQRTSNVCYVCWGSNYG